MPSCNDGTKKALNSQLQALTESVQAIQLCSALHSGSPASVVMLDLDHFNQVNDQYGHAVGDNAPVRWPA